jgi:hypothetical protein
VTELSREALFAAAWERPLTEIAEEMGITSTGLKKICDRHGIPTPGRGYWAQVRAGKRFPRPRLRPVKDPRLAQVRILGAKPLPEVVVVVLAKVRAEVPPPSRRRGKRAEPGTSDPKPELAPVPAPALETDPVPTPEEPPARADLAATRKAWSRARPDELGFAESTDKGAVRARLGTEAMEPGLRFLSRLLAATDERGWRLVATDTGAVMEVDGERLTIRLEDRPKKIPHEPTRKELTDQAQRERWGYTGQVWRRWDEVPSGRLALVIDENHWTGLRRTFSKRAGFALEESIPVILEGLAGHAAMKAESRRKSEEEARRYAIAKARRKRIEAFAKREAGREEFVGLVADRLAERARIQIVLDHLLACDPADRPGLSAMESWLRRRIGAIDARLAPLNLGVSARHAQVDFGEPPKLSDKPDWHHPPKATLYLWRLSAEDNLFHSEDDLEWAIAEGFIVDPGKAPNEDELPA